ncbi:hypothetical protein BOMU111920_16200 [Bordetella muralis]
MHMPATTVIMMVMTVVDRNDMRRRLNVCAQRNMIGLMPRRLEMIMRCVMTALIMRRLVCMPLPHIMDMLMARSAQPGPQGFAPDQPCSQQRDQCV